MGKEGRTRPPRQWAGTGAKKIDLERAKEFWSFKPVVRPLARRFATRPAFATEMISDNSATVRDD